MTAHQAFYFSVGDIVVHHKTMGFYRVLCFAKVEATLEEVVVYMEVSSRGNELPKSKIWTRPLNEFCDGRFGWVQ